MHRNCVSALFFIFYFLSTPGLSAEIKIGIAEYQPYAIASPPSGIGIEMVDRGFAKSKHKLQWFFATYTRNKMRLESDLDCIIATAFDRVQFEAAAYSFSEAYLNLIQRFFFYDKEISYQTLTDLKGKIVAVPEGVGLEKSLNEAGLAVHLITSPEQMVQMLQLKRLDIAVMPTLVGHFMAQKIFPEQRKKFIPGKKPFLIVPLEVFCKGRLGQDWIKDFDSSLLAMAKSGEMKAAFATHYPDQKVPFDEIGASYQKYFSPKD